MTVKIVKEFNHLIFQNTPKEQFQDRPIGRTNLSLKILEPCGAFFESRKTSFDSQNSSAGGTGGGTRLRRNYMISFKAAATGFALPI